MRCGRRCVASGTVVTVQCGTERVSRTAEPITVKAITQQVAALVSELRASSWVDAVGCERIGDL